MERERYVGEGSSLREQRNLREKERRMRLKDLFIQLSSHVSPTQKLPVPQLIDQATSYMIQKKDKVNNLKEKKRILLEREVKNRAEGSSFLPKLDIHSRDSDSTIEMNLVMDVVNMKRVMLHELMSVFEEGGAQVMSANIQKLNNRMAYTIIAQAPICRIGIDPSMIEKRLRDIIF